MRGDLQQQVGLLDQRAIEMSHDPTAETPLCLQVNVSEPHRAADVLLKVASLYSEEPEAQSAVLETVGE